MGTGQNDRSSYTIEHATKELENLMSMRLLRPPLGMPSWPPAGVALGLVLGWIVVVAMVTSDSLAVDVGVGILAFFVWIGVFAVLTNARLARVLREEYSLLLSYLPVSALLWALSHWYGLFYLRDPLFGLERFSASSTFALAFLVYLSILSIFITILCALIGGLLGALWPMFKNTSLLAWRLSFFSFLTLVVVMLTSESWILVRYLDPIHLALLLLTMYVLSLVHLLPSLNSWLAKRTSGVERMSCLELTAKVHAASRAGSISEGFDRLICQMLGREEPSLPGAKKTTRFNRVRLKYFFQILMQPGVAFVVMFLFCFPLVVLLPDQAIMKWASATDGMIDFRFTYAIFLAGATSTSTILSSFFRADELQKFFAEVFENDVETDSAIEMLYEMLRGR
jgi:hypothetical protein